MSDDAFWKIIQTAIRRLPTDRSGAGVEYLIETKLRPKRTNRLQIFESHLMRRSDGDKSKWRKVKKEDLLWFAKEAIQSGSQGFDIKETVGRGGPSHTGSIICVILAETGHFKYGEGQVLSPIGGISISSD